MKNQQFILYVGLPEDPRLKEQKLYEWQTDFRKIDNPIVDIMAPPSLKTRKALYENLKRLTNQPIISILYPMTWSDYMMLRENIVHDDFTQVQNKFSQLQPPVQYIDCDEIILAENSKSLYTDVLFDKKQFPHLDDHKTPHHKESISEHIIMVAEEIIKLTFNDISWRDPLSNKHKIKKINILHTVALYHDLGKYWTGQFDKNLNHYRYPNHENVSAMIFVTEMLRHPEKFDFLNQLEPTLAEKGYSNYFETYMPFDTYKKAFMKIVTQVILNHMFAKTKDFKGRAIRRRNLTDYELKILEIFTIADNRGRIK